MEKEKLHIDIPDDITIQKQINLIVERGVKKEETFFSCLKNMYNEVGIKYLFNDINEILFLVFLFLIIFTFIIMNRGFWKNPYFEAETFYVFIMIVSPILYLIISLTTFVSQKVNKTYEIEMTCKYNLFQLATFRMLIFSVLCILVNVIFIGIIVNLYNRIDFLRAFMISIFSLFLFSIISLYVMMNIHSEFTKYGVIISWIFLNIVFCIFNLKLYIKFLLTVPISLYAIVTVICIYIYIKKLKKLMKFRNVEGAN